MKKSEKTKGKARGAARKKRTMIVMAGAAAVCILAVVALFLALDSPVAKAGDTVSVLYTGMLENGSVFDSNVNTTPFTFTLGAHTVIPGFEEAVTGMARNEVRTVNIPVDKAYGPYQEELVTTVSRSLFPPESPPRAGMYYSITDPETGRPAYVRVSGVTTDTVTIDQNHLLAGENLTFVIRLVDIVPAE